jgi:hypothetical protein
LRKSHAISMKADDTFTPIKQLLEKFTFNLDAISYPLKIAFNVHKFSTVAFPTHKVSSAYLASLKKIRDKYREANINDISIYHSLEMRSIVRILTVGNVWRDIESFHPLRIDSDHDRYWHKGVYFSDTG